MAYNLGHVVGPAGKGIQGISKTDTTGLVDTYTITYSDGTTSTFTVTNGESNADVVTEWESTPSDSKVPSEKLTKESLDDKADSDHTHTGMLTTSDVKDNLTSTDTNKPLSAKQGKELKTLVDAKQPLLVSGTNIKTVNNNSLLGSGNIDIQGGGGSDVGSFSDLQALIDNASSGDVIVLDKDYKNSGNESTIEIDNKDLTILGNGHTIDADNKCRILSPERSDCNIIGVVFTNGTHSSQGGAIHVRSTVKLIVSDCVFNNNSVTNGNAGAINFSGTARNSMVYNCRFTNNSATGNGGAIHPTSYVTISDCVFEGNTADNGGAISCSSATVLNCSFFKNTATTSGGNVYCSGETPLTIYNTNFIDNEKLYNTVNKNDLNSENLVTSWSSTVTDTHIASEKLIKDTIDGLSIPTKISDLTNDSDFIETSSTSGLIKNDGTIDTNTYVDTDDIANNLTTTTSGKVLDARQGKALTDLIGDAISYINL